MTRKIAKPMTNALHIRGEYQVRYVAQYSRQDGEVNGDWVVVIAHSNGYEKSYLVVAGDDSSAQETALDAAMFERMGES